MIVSGVCRLVVFLFSLFIALMIIVVGEMYMNREKDKKEK